MNPSHPLPPVRATHEWSATSGTLTYDCWGQHGRPVLLLHPVLFDRTMWWPVAAELRPYATVIAVDLPGHGDSGRRDRYRLDELADELGQLMYGFAVHQAPVVVGHASAAPLAEAYAARNAVQAVVTVDPREQPREHCAAGMDAYLNDMRPDAVHEHYRYLAEPTRDRALLAGYQGCRLPVPAAPLARPYRRAITSSGTTGYPHLTDVGGFVRALRAML